MKGRKPLADNTKVVQLRLDAIVGTAADRNFKFMGELHLSIAFIKALVNFFGEREGVDQPVLAGRSLAADDRAHLCPGSAGSQAAFGEEGTEALNLIERDSLTFDGQTWSEHSTVAKGIGGFSDAGHLGRGELSVDGDDPPEKLSVPRLRRKPSPLTRFSSSGETV